MKASYILLVEDDPMDLKLIERALRRANVLNELVVMHDGTQALEFLAFETRLPSVIIMDLKMPGMDGIPTIRRIRANPKTALVPIVVLTNSDERGDVLESYAAGANAYVQKPVDFDQFVNAVKTVGLFWLQISQSPVIH